MNANHLSHLLFKTTNESDLEQIISIEVQTQKSPWSRAQFLEELKRKDRLCISCKINSIVVGYLFCRIVSPDSEILTLSIHPNYQNLGIGSKLLKHTISECSKIGILKCFLDVRVSNNIAIGLYEKLGFKKIHIRKNFYTDNLESAQVMMLEIQP